MLTCIVYFHRQHDNTEVIDLHVICQEQLPQYYYNLYVDMMQCSPGVAKVALEVHLLT